MRQQRLWFSLLLFVLSPLSASAIGYLDSTDIIFARQGNDTISWLGQMLGSLGDINGDGYDDIAVTSYSPTRIEVYLGGAFPDTLPDDTLLGNGRTRSAGDLTADGYDDIITVQYNYSWDSASHGKIYLFRGYGDSLGSLPSDSLEPPEPNGGFGYFWSTGLVDDDSLVDLVVASTDGRTPPSASFYSGWPLTDTTAEWRYEIDQPFAQFMRFGGMQLLDLNGDGALDICLAIRSLKSSAGRVEIFFGPDFNTIPDAVLGYPVEIEPDHLDSTDFAFKSYDLGDVDADGHANLGVSYGGKILIYNGGPAFDTIYDHVLQHGAGEMAVIGDINSDYFDDIAGYGLSTSAFNSVDIYLCGIDFDTYMDDEILRSDLPPWFIDEVGYSISPAGDFNGDGIDDFVFATQNFANGDHGAVFVVAGNEGIKTDVDDGADGLPVLPAEVELHEPYPNPFNPSTTVQFDIKRRTHVKLGVYNVLGQQVRVLVDEPLSAGEHSVVWDGRGEDGDRVSTGVYLVRLEAMHHSLTRKMVLVK